MFASLSGTFHEYASSWMWEPNDRKKEKGKQKKNEMEEEEKNVYVYTTGFDFARMNFDASCRNLVKLDFTKVKPWYSALAEKLKDINGM